MIIVKYVIEKKIVLNVLTKQSLEINAKFYAIIVLEKAKRQDIAIIMVHALSKKNYVLMILNMDQIVIQIALI
jgi:hypothetical protein